MRKATNLKLVDPEVSNPSKPYDTPLAIIENGVLSLKTLRDSLNPQDVMQRIAIAENLLKQAELVLAEQQEKRVQLIASLGGTVG